MSELENGGTRITVHDQTENGKRCFNLDWPSSSPITETDHHQKARRCMEIVQPLDGHLDFNDPMSPLSSYSDALRPAGSNMVARNATEMFENIEVLPDGRYFCRVCDRTYKTHATLTAHLRGAHLRNETRCPEINCDHISYTENQKKKHQKIHDKQKMKEMKNIPHTQGKPLHSPFPSEDVIFETLFQNTKVIPGMIKSKDDSKEGKVKYTCMTCSHVFKNPFHASKHVENHAMSPQKCFYCGEMRKGPIDLKLHIMRSHKDNRVMTRCACNRVFASQAMFQNHANKDECKAAACRNLEMREDVYYGELPAGAIIDQQTLNRFDYINNRCAQMPREADFGKKSNDLMHSGQSSSVASSDIFSGANAMVITEFGLKRAWDNTVHCEPRTPLAKRVLLENGLLERGTPKKERLEMSDYYENPASQSQQQNASRSMVNNNNVGECVYFPPPLEFPYHPFVGKYPDLQPSLQSPPLFYQDSTDSQWPVYSQFEQNELLEDKKEESDDFFTSPDSLLSKETEMGSQFLNNTGEQDIIYEELNKLEFVMPPPDENDREEDLEEILRF